MNVTYLVTLLPLLACPLGMGLMMWLMMRGHKDHAEIVTPGTAKTTATSPAVATPDSLDRLDALYLQLGQVAAQQLALAEHLTRLESTERPAEPVSGLRVGA